LLWIEAVGSEGVASGDATKKWAPYGARITWFVLLISMLDESLFRGPFLRQYSMHLLSFS
jgi:hypothetical protein